MSEFNKSQKAASPQRRLGRGLSSLIDMPSVAIEVAAPPVKADVAAPGPGASGDGPSIRMVEVARIQPSPFQPRRDFNERSLDELAASITRSGLMQPVILRAVGESFELVAGERRWRAAGRAGLTRIPAVVQVLSDSDAAEWAIVENVQRDDLNAMEKAWAFRSLGERFGLGHAEIAARVGLERSSVANLIRLTELEAEIASLISAGRLSGGHGKALLQAPAGPVRVVLAKRAAEEQWSVRRLESEAVGASRGVADASDAVAGGQSAPGVERRVRTAMVEDLERQLGEHLGSKVTITTRADGKKGKIEISFYDLDHFDDVMLRMGFRMR